jgi:hypothetical protein
MMYRRVEANGEGGAVSSTVAVSRRHGRRTLVWIVDAYDHRRVSY